MMIMAINAYTTDNHFVKSLSKTCSILLTNITQQLSNASIQSRECFILATDCIVISKHIVDNHLLQIAVTIEHIVEKVLH